MSCNLGQFDGLGRRIGVRIRQSKMRFEIRLRDRERDLAQPQLKILRVEDWLTDCERRLNFGEENKV